MLTLLLRVVKLYRAAAHQDAAQLWLLQSKYSTPTRYEPGGSPSIRKEPGVSPVVVNLGFDPVWFTVLFAVCLQTSFLTPPVGFAIFYLKGVAPDEVDVVTIYKGVAPFIALQIIGLVIIFNWQAVVTWLPEQAYR